jgi:cellulose synthase/poly-beta-1,6-N-acetylglucosamine synthase-like glycosyltransferase
LSGSDGSSDKTMEIVSKYASDKLKLFCNAVRQGKPSVLSMLAKEAKGELLVFTDARQRLDAISLKELVKHFADEKVGSVSGELHFEGEGSQASEGMGLYWKYEKFIRKSESRMGSMLGATGALYAIRKDLFPQLPKDLILDDVYIPLKIVEKGYRAIFDKKAKVFDRYSRNAKEEFLRKTRTLAGNFQLFIHLRELFNPLRGKISWQFFSHKFLRLMVPFLLMILFTANLFLLGQVGYKVFFILQAIFYTFALLGAIFKQSNRLFDVPYMFCIMNAAAVMGLYKFLSGGLDVKWERPNSP